MNTVVKIILSFTLVYLFSKGNCEDADVIFQYVTSYNREGRFITKEDIEKTTVNVLKPVIFIIDGLINDDKHNDTWNKQLKDAYVEKLISNVFIVDWNISAPPDATSINKAHSAGLTLADFIATIFNKTGEAYLDIHLVGISLGCEVAASAAGRVSELIGRKVNRITGLDPTYYLINNEGDSRRLSVANADFVDVVHTNFSQGKFKQIGHVDFYVDDLGDKCESEDSDILPECATLKSTVLFATSVNSFDIKAKKCDDLENFRNGKCDDEDEIVFGENAPKDAKGTYFLNFSED